MLRQPRLILLYTVAMRGCAMLALMAPGLAIATTAPAPEPPSNAPGSNVSGVVGLLTNHEFWLSVVVMAFALLILAVSLVAIVKTGKARPGHIITAVSVNLIVTGTLVTIIGGFSDKQLAPVFGLFGTIAGYMLGKSSESFSNKPGDEEDKKRVI